MICRGTLGGSVSILLLLLVGFAATLIIISRRLQLYALARLNGFLHEQRLSTQACFTLWLLLMGALYLLHVGNISRGIVLLTIVLVTLALGVRRLIYRSLLYRRYVRGMDTRNVLIVGTGAEAQALRHRLEIAIEVKEYKLNHLRRLNVMPGITGLWQVQGRKDPSFDSYVSLDMTYIDNWSIWLDATIIPRTIGVVLAGTGS